MTERIQSNLLAARDALQEGCDGMPADERRALVVTIIDTLVCDEAVEDHVVTDLVDLLARDPDTGAVDHRSASAVCGPAHEPL